MSDWKAKIDAQIQKEIARDKIRQSKEEKKRRQRAAKEQASKEREARAEDARFRKWQEPYRCSVCRQLTAGHCGGVHERQGALGYNGYGPPSYKKCGTLHIYNVMQCKKSGFFSKHWVCLSDKCQYKGICRNCAKKL